MGTGDFTHISVLLDECVSALRIRPDGVYLDGTLGGGGHACEVVKRLQNGHLIGIDQDEDAIRAAGEKLAAYGERVRIYRNNFRNFREVLREDGEDTVDGILLDLGISSHQIDDPSRGFSYMHDGPLDMRMDQDGPVTAADLVNTLPKEELVKILRDYGEEKFAARIADAIVRERKTSPLRTTAQLSDLIRQAVPMKADGGHPAKRSFQALRIAVNEELTILSDVLEEMIDALNSGGRIAVISFHSLEDRIVKTTFRRCEHPCICPPDLPVCVCGKRPKGQVITRHPVLPGEDETENNPRARSAKLRVFEKK